MWLTPCTHEQRWPTNAHARTHTEHVMVLLIFATGVKVVNAGLVGGILPGREGFGRFGEMGLYTAPDILKKF